MVFPWSICTSGGGTETKAMAIRSSGFHSPTTNATEMAVSIPVIIVWISPMRLRKKPGVGCLLCPAQHIVKIGALEGLEPQDACFALELGE